MISDPWIQRGPRPARMVKTDAIELQLQRERRATLKTLGLCICGPLAGTVSKSGLEHGPVYKGGRCERCWTIKAAHDERVPRTTRAR